MKRKIIQQLKLWKDNPARKPLILLGARQVGKTWVMKHFGLTEFENVAYINCDVEPLAKELFAADYNIPVFCWHFRLSQERRLKQENVDCIR